MPMAYLLRLVWEFGQTCKAAGNGNVIFIKVYCYNIYNIFYLLYNIFVICYS